MTDKSKVLVLAILTVALDALSEIPNTEKDEALALLKAKLDEYKPGEAVPVSQLINDLKAAVEATEDIAGKANLIPATETAFDIAQALAGGASPFIALVKSIFHKHTA